MFKVQSVIALCYRPALLRSSSVEEYTRGSYIPCSRMNFGQFYNYIFKLLLALLVSSIFITDPGLDSFSSPFKVISNI